MPGAFAVIRCSGLNYCRLILTATGHRSARKCRRRGRSEARAGVRNSVKDRLRSRSCLALCIIMFFSAAKPAVIAGEGPGPTTTEREYVDACASSTSPGSVDPPPWRRVIAVLLALGCPCGRAGVGADHAQILARRAAGRAGRALPGPAGQGLLPARRARCDHRRGATAARTDHPRRLRQPTTSALPTSTRSSRYRDQNPSAPVKAVFMVYNRPPFAIVARKSRGITEPKQPRGQEARRAADRRHLPAMAAVRQAQRHRRVEGDDREHRHAGARADARRRTARRGARLLVPGLCRSQGPRRAGRRHRADADGELRPQALRQRDHREFQVRRREAGGGQGVPARLRARGSRTRSEPGHGR